jgi:chorismate synthase
MVGVTIDGCPPGLTLDVQDFLPDLNKRKSGTVGTTPRAEKDLPDIISGVYQGKTTGAPITVLFENQNIQSKDYSQFEEIPRPGHADFVAMKKFDDFNDKRGGGHFSGRITIGLVAAGVLAKKIITPIKINAELTEAGGSEDMEQAVQKAIKSGDSIGGIVQCVASNMPVGLGEPFFNSAESVISHLAFSVPAIKGIEFGAGFKAARMTGSEHNDWIIDPDGKTETNNSGGINGGITNGNDLVFRIVVKPTSSISQVQKTVNVRTGKHENLKIEGRHDTCIALRMPVIIEAITAIALSDLLLVDRAKKKLK